MKIKTKRMFSGVASYHKFDMASVQLHLGPAMADLIQSSNRIESTPRRPSRAAAFLRSNKTRLSGSSNAL